LRSSITELRSSITELQGQLTTLTTRVAGMRSLMIVGLIILAILIYFRFRY
jgi:hypothetical protein